MAFVGKENCAGSDITTLVFAVKGTDQWAVLSSYRRWQLQAESQGTAELQVFFQVWKKKKKKRLKATARAYSNTCITIFIHIPHFQSNKIRLWCPATFCESWLLWKEMGIFVLPCQAGKGPCWTLTCLLVLAGAWQKVHLPAVQNNQREFCLNTKLELWF